MARSLGERMRRLRTERGLTQQELAAPDYTAAYVSTIESGKRIPSRDALAHFAARLGVEPEELSTGRPSDLVPRLRIDLQEAREQLASGEGPSAEATFRRAEREARRYGLTRIHADAVCGLAELEIGRGQTDVALDLYEKADDLLRDEPPTARVDAIVGRASCLRMIGDVKYSTYVLESGLRTLEEAGLKDPDALVRLHTALVASNFQMGAVKEAAASATQALRLAPRIGDPEKVAAMHMNAARVYLEGGAVDDALASLTKAEEFYRRSDLESDLALCHLNRGIVLSSRGEVERAWDELETAREIFVNLGSAVDEARATNELARLERSLGDLDAARDLLQHSLELLVDGESPALLAWAHRELGFVEHDAGDLDRAEKGFRAALEIYERLDNPTYVASTYRALGDVLKAKGEERGGCEAYRSGLMAVEQTL